MRDMTMAMHPGFVDFLMASRRSGWAGDGSLSLPALPEVRQRRFAEGDLSYVDMYFGAARFSGMETVWLAESPVWSMVYHGGVMPGVEASPVYDFLREALLRVPPGMPFRGPERYARGRYCYECHASGTTGAFTGDEGIYEDGLLVYGLNFAGGRVI